MIGVGESNSPRLIINFISHHLREKNRFMFRIKSFLCGCCQSDANRGVEEQVVSIPDPQRTGPETIQITVKTETNAKIMPKIIISDVEKTKLLNLRVIEGDILPDTTEITINPFGVIEGGRKKQDGITYFGSQKYTINPATSEQELYNDILLNDVSVGSQHAMISYDPSAKSYYLKDLGEGSGTFIKIDQELQLKSGFTISFGDTHMLALINETNEGPTLVLKFVEGLKINEVYTFKPLDKIAKVGRMSDCEIKFDGTNLSRYQCTLEYKEDKGWVVSDGFNGKPSTNGTWLFVQDFFEITQDEIVKIGQTLFKITLAT